LFSVVVCGCSKKSSIAGRLGGRASERERERERLAPARGRRRARSRGLLGTGRKTASVLGLPKNLLFFELPPNRRERARHRPCDANNSHASFSRCRFFSLLFSRCPLFPSPVFLAVRIRSNSSPVFARVEGGDSRVEGRWAGRQNARIAFCRGPMDRSGRRSRATPLDAGGAASDEVDRLGFGMRSPQAPGG
jgi:hypothetical protein